MVLETGQFANMLQQDGATREHLLGILAALLQCLPAHSAQRIRLLAKFVEKDYQKIERLMELRRVYAAKVGVAEDEIKEERELMNETDREGHKRDWLSKRLDAGLFCLQVQHPKARLEGSTDM